MKIKSVLLVIVSLLVAGSLRAQNTDGATWSFELGGGVNAMYDSGKLLVGPSAHLGVLLWAMPQVGFRVVGQVGSCPGMKGNDRWPFGDNFLRAGLSLDVLWDVINTFSTTYQGRYHVQPYARIQNIIAYGNKEAAFVLGIAPGIRQTFSLSEHWSVLLDGSAILFKEKDWTGGDGRLGFVQVYAGMVYNL